MFRGNHARRGLASALCLAACLAASAGARAFEVLCDFGVCTSGWDGPGRGGATVDWYLGNPHQANNGLPAGATLAQAEAEVRAAMATWSSVADIRFNKAGDYRDGLTAYAPDTMYIYWAAGDHGHGAAPPEAFDGAWNPTTGAGYVLAHSWGPPDISGYSGNIHLDADETWVTAGAAIGATSATIDMQSILLHELGHSLGLAHEDDLGAGLAAPVMQSLYWGELRALTQDDIDGIQSLYGREGFCWPAHRGVPYDTDPPAVDGRVQEDVGWRGARRLTYGDGVEPAHMALQALHHRTQDYLYVSVEVRNDPSFDDTDALVLAFRPDAASAAAAGDLRLVIFPNCDTHGAAGPACTLTTPSDKTDRDPRLLQLWRNSAAWTLAGAQPANLEVKVRSYPDGTANAWNVEVKLPTSTTTGGAGWVDFSDDFLFYANAIRVSGAAGTATELRWPRKALEVSGALATYPFRPAEWGDGTKDPAAACNGVSLALADVGTTNTPASTIGVTAVPNSFTNTFFATPRNATEVSGAAVPAEDVRVRFRIANWGLPGPRDWEDIPAANPGCPDPGLASNPSCPQDIPAAAGGVPGSATFNLDWRVADADVLRYQANPHQCILVELDALSGANIATKSVYRNMDFVTASRFSRAAEISARGYPPPPGGAPSHQVSIQVTKREWQGALGKAQPTALAPGAKASYLTWGAHGYRHLGSTLTIGEREYELVEPVGSFGYVVEHRGAAVAEWMDRLVGAERVTGDLYRVAVPQDGSVTVITEIEPREHGLFNWLTWLLLALFLLLMLLFVLLWFWRLHRP